MKNDIAIHPNMLGHNESLTDKNHTQVFAKAILFTCPL